MCSSVSSLSDSPKTTKFSKRIKSIFNNPLKNSKNTDIKVQKINKSLKPNMTLKNFHPLSPVKVISYKIIIKFLEEFLLFKEIKFEFK